MTRSRSGASSKRGSGSIIKRQYLAKLEDWELGGKSSYIVYLVIAFEIQPFFCAITVQIVYLFTVNPTIVGGDNGEIVTNTVQLGMIHSPGRKEPILVL